MTLLLCVNWKSADLSKTDRGQWMALTPSYLPYLTSALSQERNPRSNCGIVTETPPPNGGDEPPFYGTHIRSGKLGRPGMSAVGCGNRTNDSSLGTYLSSLSMKEPTWQQSHKLAFSSRGPTTFNVGSSKLPSLDSVYYHCLGSIKVECFHCNGDCSSTGNLPFTFLLVQEVVGRGGAGY